MQEDGQNRGPHGEPPSPDTLSPPAVLDDFCALQDEFADCVQAAEGLDLRRIRVGSPALLLLRISLGAWFEAHLGHERRPLAQMRRILSNLDAGGSGHDG